MLLSALLLLTSTVAVPTGAAQTVGDIAVRDRLIVDQENLLNVYRCRFGVDAQVVPGGCSGGVPIEPPANPPVFSGTPTRHDLRVRDDLVAAQEKLLNTYRCMFNIDTQLVPGGCGGRAASYGYWQLVEEERSVGYALSSDTRQGIAAVLHIYCYFVSEEQNSKFVRLFLPGASGLNGTVSFDHADGPVLVQEWIAGEFPEHTMLLNLGEENVAELFDYLRRRRAGRTSVGLEGERWRRALFWIDGAADAVAVVERVCT